MTDLQAVTRWVEGYQRAWESNDPDDIGALFTDGAEYFTAPYRKPIAGRSSIIDDWIERKDEPGETQFEWHPVVITDELAIVEGTTRYPDQTYSNLWVIQLDPSGRCTRFVEWWMEHPGEPSE
jgi:hypothetical protein